MKGLFDLGARFGAQVLSSGPRCSVQGPGAQFGAQGSIQGPGAQFGAPPRVLLVFGTEFQKLKNLYFLVSPSVPAAAPLTTLYLDRY